MGHVIFPDDRPFPVGTRILYHVPGADGPPWLGTVISTRGRPDNRVYIQIDGAGHSIQVDVQYLEHDNALERLAWSV